MLAPLHHITQDDIDNDMCSSMQDMAMQQQDTHRGVP
jgi:hypothetical protein